MLAVPAGVKAAVHDGAPLTAGAAGSWPPAAALPVFCLFCLRLEAARHLRFWNLTQPAGSSFLPECMQSSAQSAAQHVTAAVKYACQGMAHSNVSRERGATSNSSGHACLSGHGSAASWLSRGAASCRFWASFSLPPAAIAGLLPAARAAGPGARSCRGRLLRLSMQQHAACSILEVPCTGMRESVSDSA